MRAKERRKWPLLVSKLKAGKLNWHMHAERQVDQCNCSEWSRMQAYIKHEL
jgi:hypothetical protein